MDNSSRLTSKGQIVIPAWLRKKLGLKAGMRVSFSESGNDIIVHPQTHEYFQSMAGIWGAGNKELKILIDERKRDAVKENAKIKRFLRS
ncbi:MAG: AbrB/MazE/SpoVT family DNA-binding domain-containing protein [Ignavibacteriota bacterium]